MPSRTLRAGAAAVFVIGAAAAATVLGARARSATPPVSGAVRVTCPSSALGGTLPAAVYVPAGYSTGSLRYPVVYFLHGLPAGPTSYEATRFVADGVAKSGRAAIVVAPQGVRTEGGDPEYLDWGPQEDWPTAIAQDLTRCIDSRFRTIRSRSGRALVGVSAGGFGAFNIGLRKLGVYAAVEAWSGYFTATDPSGLHKLNLGSTRADRKARVRAGRRLVQAVARRPTFIGFYVGQADGRFLAGNLRLDRTFTQKGVPHVFKVYPGGHDQGLWSARAATWLGLALRQLSPARPA